MDTLSNVVNGVGTGTDGKLHAVQETSTDTARKLSPSDMRRAERRAALNAALADSRTETAERRAAVQAETGNLKGEEKRVAGIKIRREHKATRLNAALASAETNKVAFTMPTLDPVTMKGATTATVVYTDPTTGLETRAALKITVQLTDSVTLKGAALKIID